MSCISMSPSILVLVLACILIVQHPVQALVGCARLGEFCNNKMEFNNDKCVKYCVEQKGFASGTCEPIEDHVVDVNVLQENAGLQICACRTPSTAGDIVHVKCFGDPHCISADNSAYEAMQVGKYVVMQNDKRGPIPKFRIVTSLRPTHLNDPDCPTSVATSHELQIYGQSFNLNSFNHVRNVWAVNAYHNGEDISARLPYTYFDKGKFVNVYRIDAHMFVEASIGIELEAYGTSYIIRMPNTPDFANVRGMMGAGQSDGDPTNDHVYPNGTAVYPLNDDVLEAWNLDVINGARRARRQEAKRLPQCTKAGKKAIRKNCNKYLQETALSNPFASCLAAETELFQKPLGNCQLELCYIPDDDESLFNALPYQKYTNRAFTIMKPHPELVTAAQHQADAIQILCELYEDLEKKCERKGHAVNEWRKYNFCKGTCDDPNAKWSKCVKGSVKSCNKAIRNNARLNRRFVEDGECFSGCHCKPRFFTHPVTHLCVPKAECP